MNPVSRITVAIVFGLVLIGLGFTFGKSNQATVYGAGYLTGETMGTYTSGTPIVLQPYQSAGLQMDKNGGVYVAVTGTVRCQ